MSSISPYPSFGELLRECASILSSKPIGKDFDKFVNNGDLDYGKLNRYFEDVFKVYTGLSSKWIDDRLAQIRIDLRNKYTELLKEFSLCGYTRKQSVPWLLQTVLIPLLHKIFKYWREYQELAPSEELLKNKGSIGWSFQWLIRFFPEFKVFESNLTKEEKDDLWRWKSGKNIPEFDSINLILSKFYEEEKLSESEKDLINEVFYLSIVIKRLCKKVTVIDMGEVLLEKTSKKLNQNEHYEFLNLYLDEAPYSTFSRIKQILLKIEEIKEKLLYNQDRSKKGEIEDLLIDAEDMCCECKNLNPPIMEIHRLRGIWYIFSGLKKDALDCYKHAIKSVLYTGYERSIRIFEEACMLAALHNDRVYLKKLKQQGIILGFFSEPIPVNDSIAEKKHKSNGVIEDWEVKRWRDKFYHDFPSSMYFKGVKADTQNEARLSSGILPPEDFKYELDLRYPNKRITRSDGKRIPQLSYFIGTQERIEFVQKLLEKGADVNQLTSSGESSLLFAVDKIVNHQNEQFFDVLSKYPHHKDIMNMPTSKKRLTILGQAVETLRTDIIQKVIDMGADVDHRMDIDQYTPLFRAVTLLYYSTQSEGDYQRLLKGYEPNKIQEGDLEGYRRFSPLAEITNKSNAESIKERLKSLRNQKILSTIIDYQASRKPKNSRSVLEVIKVLLRNGADPNAENTINGIKGFTPLILAKETNLIHAFELFNNSGGDLN